MKNDSPKNFNCEFAAESLDFLYGEMNGERKNAFQTHLGNCSDCADEIEDFSGIRFSIRDWKAAEFDNLATPAILIPYETPALKTVETEKSVSWFASIRNYLTFSPVLSGAMAVLIFAVLVGFGIFVLNKNSDNDLIADTNQKPNLNVKPSELPQPSVVPKKDETINPPEVVKNDDAVIDEKQKPEIPAQVNNESTAKQKIQPVKTTEKKTSKSNSLNDTKNAKVIPNKNKPRLNELPEEDEDNSLRLADLFAELETRK